MSIPLIDDDVKLEQAAQFLNVSQPYLLQLLEQGAVDLNNLAAYKAERKKISQQALQQLVDQAQELDMGY
ncbi:hypothetical protein GTP45_21160 [Pseudoduganella sp. FT55W]|uniref:Helix-turn-helix domain-containing protein n=1 Tax=Duganella rivi TaxID=2666083 RepID=A0A7X4GTD0_9BURK|nr:hypothetical protein [Duganella rivi]MYM69328.1 hypothetical protein [Duganella rivi]